MARRQREAKDEALRLAIREKERRLALIALDKVMHEMAEMWRKGVLDAPTVKAYRESLDRAKRSMKD
jgi:hypothetical protein